MIDQPGPGSKIGLDTKYDTYHTKYHGLSCFDKELNILKLDNYFSNILVELPNYFLGNVGQQF